MRPGGAGRRAPIAWRWGGRWQQGPTQPLLSWGRFGAVEDNAGALRLYTVQVPHKRERRPPPCYLTKWDGKSFLPLLTRPCGTEVVSCLSIRYPGGTGAGTGAHTTPRSLSSPRSDSGTFLGLGTVTGSVAIHIAFSLQVSRGGRRGSSGAPPPRGRAAWAHPPSPLSRRGCTT